MIHKRKESEQALDISVFYLHATEESIAMSFFFGFYHTKINITTVHHISIVN